MAFSTQPQRKELVSGTRQSAATFVFICPGIFSTSTTSGQSRMRSGRAGLGLGAAFLA